MIDPRKVMESTYLYEQIIYNKWANIVHLGRDIIPLGSVVFSKNV
jgi:hypothetical protein